jgi:hypothetical protein
MYQLKKRKPLIKNDLRQTNIKQNPKISPSPHPD